MITRVEINESIQKQLDRDIGNGYFDSEVRDLIAFWRIEIQEVGFEEYARSSFSKVLGDHKLSGKREGQRSIALNNS